MAIIIFVISVFLLVASIVTVSVYAELREITLDYISSERSVYQMQESSDYLTDQVRSFTETGSKVNLNNYFRECEVTKRREKALEELADSFGETEIYNMMSQALDESNELMQIEFYAMRLMAESKDFDISTLPEQIQQIELTKDDSEYSRYGKEKRAQEIVFGDDYRARKERISEITKECMTILMNEIGDRQAVANDRFGFFVATECGLIVILIATVFITVFMTRFQIINPLIRAIPMIQDDQPIEVVGSSEFRFLAKTYNQMYEENITRKKELAYEASHDPLTGVLNRNGYEKLIQNKDLHEAVLLLIDIDHFKGVNDTCGHEIGDKLLIRVTKTVKKYFRADDTLCRVGGDEFVQFMFGSGRKEKDLIREKIGQINKELQQPLEDMPATSVSVGVAFGNGQSVENIYKMADEALYYVKYNGRCGCAFYDDIK